MCLTQCQSSFSYKKVTRVAWRSAVSAVFAELRAQGRLQLQAADEQALLQVGVYVGHACTCTRAAQG